MIRFGECNPKAAFQQTVEFHQHAKTESELPALGKWPVGSDGLVVAAGPSRIAHHRDGTVSRIVPLELRVNASDKAGLKTVALQAPLSSPTSSPSQILYVNWSVRNLYDIDPILLVFTGSSTAEDSIARRLTIRRIDGLPLRVLSCRASLPILQVESRPAEPGAEIIVSLNGESLSGGISWGEVELQTDLPAQPIVSIPVAVLQQRK